MNTFDLDGALANWRQNLVGQGTTDPAILAELESALYDRYEANLLKDMPPAEAFDQARLRVSQPTSEDGIGQRNGWSLGYLLPNYLKVTFRNLRSHSGYNLINFLCLALAIFTTALAGLYLHYETSFDGALPEVDRKFRVGMNLRSQGYSMLSFEDYSSSEAATQLKMVEGLEALRGVEQATQFQTFTGPQLVRLNGRELAAEQLLHTNTAASFCDYFAWSFLRGSAADFSAAPFTAVLTKAQAERFFGTDWRSTDLSSLTLSIDTTDYTVAGIIANPPANSHFTFNIALHQPLIGYWGPRLYLKAAPGETMAGLRERINENFSTIHTRLAGDDLFGGVILQPLRSIHLQSDLLYELKPPGKPAYLYLIGLIALVILLLTLSNYTNLSVAMNARRAREIGMRKVFGASTGQIAGQFLLEAVVLSCLTIPVALLALYLLLPHFDALMGTGLVEVAKGFGGYWWLLVLIALVVGLLASVYPAFFLARQQILGLFHRKLGATTGQRLPARKVIITLQFVLLIGLCSLALFVNRQLRFLLDKDLGYETEQILYVNLNADSSRFVTFRDQLLRLPEVTGVGSGDPLGQNPYNQTTYQLAGTAETFDDANNVYFDYRSLDLLEIETSIPEYVANPDDAPAQMVLINRTLAERLKNRFQLSDTELIGKTIIQEPEYTDEATGEVGFPYVIGGTFADINMFSLRERVDPMFMTVYKNPRYVYWAAIRYQHASPAEILAKVRTEYDRLNLDKAFVHEFLRTNLRQLYEEEARIATLSTYFSLAAFLTAVLGLIALTAYLTTVRRREIGIRRILGASQGDILRRFNLEYLPLLGIGLVIAVPLAWLGLDWWLSGFAYRISLHPVVFLLAGLITLLVTLIAVSVVTIRAANAIPARVLSEN